MGGERGVCRHVSPDPDPAAHPRHLIRAQALPSHLLIKGPAPLLEFPAAAGAEACRAPVGEAPQGLGQGSSNLLLVLKTTRGFWDRDSGNGPGCGFV